MDWLDSKWLAKTELASQKLLHQEVASFLSQERLLDNSGKLHSPFLMQDMHAAVERIIEAISQNENIMIHGDYDVDGLSATAILLRFFKKLGLNPLYYIPSRLDEGYGLKGGGIEFALEHNIDLMITVDCGIQSVDEVDLLTKSGVDVIVTDHHTVGDSIPEATAVLNPHRSDCQYPFEHLAGAGVSLKLLEALAKDLNISVEEEYYALASLGTIADVMLLTGENRFIVKRGVEAIRSGVLPGVTLMLELLNKSTEISAQDLAYQVIPKLNAAGRMGDSSPVLRFFLEDNPLLLNQAIQDLFAANEQRKTAEQAVESEILIMVRENPSLIEQNILLLKGDTWHPGVLGIVASRIKERFHKPCIVFSSYGEERAEDNALIYRGSGRSAGNFHLFQAIASVSDLLLNFGGHQSACGLTIAESNWDDFCDRLWSRPHTEIEEEPQVMRTTQEGAKVFYYDAVLSEASLNLTEASGVLNLGPFGNGNEEPLFVFPNLEVVEARVIGKDKKHLRLGFKIGYLKLFAIAFAMADYEPFIKLGDSIDVLGKLQINTWNNMQSVQIMVEDIALDGEAGEVFSHISQENTAPPEAKAFTNGQDFVDLWHLLSQLIGKKHTMLSTSRLRRLLYLKSGQYFAISTVEAMLDVFVEAGLMASDARLNGDVYVWYITENENRVKLSNTLAWQKMVKEGKLYEKT